MLPGAEKPIMIEGVINVEDFDPSVMANYPLLKRPRGNPSGNKSKYIDCIATFDIETSRLPEIEQTFMYIWQMDINRDYTIVGRTWSSWLDLLIKMREFAKGQMVVYVHNLSFEM